MSAPGDGGGSRRSLLKLAGFSAILSAVMQVVGNILHGAVPADADAALTHVAHHTYWVPAHLILISGYAVLIVFAVGLSGLLERTTPLVALALPLMVVGAVVGPVHFMIHLGVYTFAAQHYVATTDPAVRYQLTQLFDVFRAYAGAMDLMSLLAIFAAGVLFAAAMLRDAAYPSWMGWLGIVAGVVAAAGILIAIVFLPTPAGSLIFGVMLIPLVFWMGAVGVRLLRLVAVAPK